MHIKIAPKAVLKLSKILANPILPTPIILQAHFPSTPRTDSTGPFKPVHPAVQIH